MYAGARLTVSELEARLLAEDVPTVFGACANVGQLRESTHALFA